ncbi:hypothetical protein SLS53_008590 [Cytospora paraplurivora]|uniref:BZIP domain-containing protein n=1 Tax=Cytospora paraplurivora TaxID=2898453 RepID=A0AAN9U070_9PEZI
MGSAEPNPAGIDYSHVEDNGSTSFNKTTNEKMERGAIATTNAFYDANKAMYGPSYPQYSGFFDYNEAGTTPTDSLLLSSNGDVQFAIPTAPGDNSWSHRHAWDPDNTTGLAFDTDMPPSSSLIPHTPAPFVWGGMSNFEPMVATTWPIASGERTSAAAPESPMSARNSSQQSTTERSSSSSRSRRPSIARYHSSTASAVANSPASTTADTLQQREQARFGNRHNKRRMSGLEPPLQQRHQGSSKGMRPAVVTATPLTPSTRPTPSPMEDQSTIFVAGDTYRHTIFPNHPDISRQTNFSPQQLQESQPPPPPSMNCHDDYAMGQPQPALPPLPPPPQQQQQQQQQQHASQALRERNRAAANKCRRKSKAVVADLEATERELSDEHEQLSQTARGLREEVLALKNALLVHGHCDDEVIQQYLANSARLVGNGGEAGQGPRGHHGFM